MRVRPRPEQSRHRSPHVWHARPLHDHVLTVELVYSGAAPEPEPDAGDDIRMTPNMA